MTIGFGARLAGSVFLAVTLLTAAGCGYKNDPVPPESVVPRPIDDLRYRIDESGVTLTWTYPVETIRGDELDYLSAFDIYRAVVPLEEVCANCPIPFGEPLEIPGGVTIREGKRRVAEYQSSLLRSGHKYFFKVRSRNSWWAASQDSNIVSFIWHVPVSAPDGLTAEAADSRITLSWEPVTTLINGSPVTDPVSYQVLRSAGGKDFEPLGEPVEATSFSDSRVINGQKYFYRVQSRMLYEGELISGGSSEIVDATPVDQTPPPIPAGVRAVESGAGIKIFWEPVDDPEVGGYRIYRRAADSRTPELVGEVTAGFSLYEDTEVPSGTRFYYSVTAIDRADPPNESQRSRESTIR